ncbi:MAG: transketolase family protein [Kiloniellales bacterium]
MRNTFADTFYALAREDPRLCVVVADISPAGSMARFREEFPERFINTGVAEQSMIGIAAGMALRGLRPFAYTIATFTLYRPFEFVRSDLCYQELPVTLVGIGGGVTYSTLGGTHHAQEDVAIATAMPNMTVIAPCDPAEVREATTYCTRDNEGPVYLRLGKAGEPELTADAPDRFVVGRIRYLRKGRDGCILSYGPTVKLASDVADRLEAQGQTTSVVSVHTLKPLDVAGIVEALRSHRRVVVIEEHSPYGGLGPRVKEIAWDNRVDCEVVAFSLKDAFIHAFGSHAELRAAHGLDADTIIAGLNGG